MTFIDYCIATKNYSALSAVNEYTKVFGWIDNSNYRKAYKDGYVNLPTKGKTNPGIVGAAERRKAAEELNRRRNGGGAKDEGTIASEMYWAARRDPNAGMYNDDMNNDWRRDQINKEKARARRFFNK